MAPLLGRKPFPLVKPLPGEEPLFTIAHTQEAFRTREYPFLAAPAWLPAGWGRVGPGIAGPEGHAALRRWQLSACSAMAGLHPEPEPAVLERGAGGGVGRLRSGPPEPGALHRFLRSALCPRASRLRRDPPPPTPWLVLGPKYHGKRGFLCFFFLFKLNLQLKLLKLYPRGLVIRLVQVSTACYSDLCEGTCVFLLRSGL